MEYFFSEEVKLDRDTYHIHEIGVCANYGSNMRPRYIRVRKKLVMDDRCGGERAIILGTSTDPRRGPVKLTVCE